MEAARDSTRTHNSLKQDFEGSTHSYDTPPPQVLSPAEQSHGQQSPPSYWHSGVLFAAKYTGRAGGNTVGSTIVVVLIISRRVRAV